jgi:hypothetical protein
MASFIGRPRLAVYHELVPLPWISWRLAACSVCVALACSDAHWASVRWPNDRPGTPRQPVLDATALGLAVRATSIDYDPEGVALELMLENYGDALLRIERRAITLGWDELEYASESAGPEWIELEPGASEELRLRYTLGRPLTGSGSRLILRSITRDGIAVVELPALRLPAMPHSL